MKRRRRIAKVIRGKGQLRRLGLHRFPKKPFDTAPQTFHEPAPVRVLTFGG